MEIAPRRPRVTVLGAGYLGVSHAACLASLGFEVLAMDTDGERLESLKTGNLPFFEPDLAELLRNGLAEGRLRFTSTYREVAEFGDVHFICVGTPQHAETGAADLTQLKSCVAGLAPLLEGSSLVVGKSTVPVGTAAALSQQLLSLTPVGSKAELAWNPEFLREGSAVADTLHPDRIVIGIQSRAAENLMRVIYAAPLLEGAKLFVTDFETAELSKFAANSFLATKISFINAMAEVCEAAGGDVRVLADVLGSDPRIGSSHLRPGAGFGGGCLPKDIRAFMSNAAEIGAGESVQFLREIDSINLRCRSRIIALACGAMGGPLRDQHVAILGLAFKPESDDIRDSPALEVAVGIRALGAQVTVYDPAAMKKAKAVHPNLTYADSMLSAVSGADIVLMMTEWPEFVQADPVILGRLVAAKVILDGRSAINPSQWRREGWRYFALGQSWPGSRCGEGRRDMHSHRADEIDVEMARA